MINRLKNEAAWLQLKPHLDQVERGQHLSVQWFETRCEAWAVLRPRIVRYLRTRGLYPIAVPGDGYRIGKGDEMAIDEPKRRARRAQRQLAIGIGGALTTPDSELTERGKAGKRHAVERLGAMAQALQDARKDQRTLLGAPNPAIRKKE